ncbi:LOW QUALITY PROTEIN: plasma protease C1 inhibitor [Pogoniulus pusillus]|uniref:LOW QUALITY PROTEIN: plasma protease C1 inhibitor n=1 Tax=Pogoniulus pusillus TaxID=488313 RepID=UPI0030B954DA
MPTPGELSILDAPSKARNYPISKAPERVPEELGTMANESTVALSSLGTDASDISSLGTSSPLCPGDEEPAETCGVPTGEQRAAMAEALGTFALHFYQHIAEAAQPDANLVFSPITVAMGLSHLLLGARGETRECLGAILAYPPELGCVHSTLWQLANVSGPFSAAQIFHHPEVHLQPRFLSESWHFYGARPRALSGNESLDLLQVNEWVREASHGLLPGLLPSMPTQPQLLLLSTVHLHGTDWCMPLNAKQIVPMPFLQPGHLLRLVPTMTSLKYPVGSFTNPHLQVQVGRLELSLVMLVPRGPLAALSTLERALDPPTFLELLRQAVRTPSRATALALPCLRLGHAVDVVALVHDMGFGLLLAAELRGLAWGQALTAGAARHRALLELDEAGLEAAGAMATSVARTTLVLEALRPFLFVPWHDDGNIPLFMGRLSDPRP